MPKALSQNRTAAFTLAKALSVAAVAAFAGLTTAPAMAETATVSKMTYKNNGRYNAFFNVRYNLADGKNCTVYLPGEAFTGGGLTAKSIENAYGVKDVKIGTKNKKNVSVDLTSDQFKVYKGPDRCLSGGAIPSGERVWGKVDIDAGDAKSCKKSIELIAGNGGTTVDYRTGGTTLNDNRCKQNVN